MAIDEGTWKRARNIPIMAIPVDPSCTGMRGADDPKREARHRRRLSRDHYNLVPCEGIGRPILQDIYGAVARSIFWRT